MVDIGGIFKSDSMAMQFVIWNVLSGFIQPLLNPAMSALSAEIWSLDPNIPVPAELLASMVNRGLVSEQTGKAEASRTGIGGGAFDKMVNAAGSGPSMAEVIELWRRGKIGQGSPEGGGTSFEAAMKDAGVRDEWIPLLADLKVNKPTGEAALNALLQGQISSERAHALWLQAGEDPDWFTDAFNSQGASPTPDMLGTMANRRIIAWKGTGAGATTFQQGFLEGPWRNKWEEPMRRLQEYLPPPRTVTAMIHAGSLTDAQALDLFQKEGLSVELAAAYVADAHHTAATADKELAKTEILALYKAHKIDRAKTLQLLEHLKYSPENATLILSLADIQKADTHLTAALGRVRTLFTSHKITEPAADDALKSLHVTDAQRSELITLWKLELGLNVRQLTEGQIVGAFAVKVLTQAEAQTELEHLGYTPFDAWVLLSTRNKQPLPNKPAPGPGVGVNP